MKKFNLNTLRQPFIIIMVGPPLVGKSTAVKEWVKSFKGKVRVISRDAILLEKHGSDNYAQAYNTVNAKEVDDELETSMIESNDNRENVIIDMTHLGSKRRKENLSYYDNDYYKVAAVFDIPKRDELLKRNELRSIKENKFIPIHVLDRMCGQFTPISSKEGFNKTISL
jgi:predicted kinase